MKRFFSGIIATLLLVALLSGCSSAPPRSAASNASYDYSPREAAPSASGEAAEDSYAASLPLLTPSNALGRKLVYTVELKLQTTAFPEGTRKLLREVEKMEGYVQSAYVEGRDLYGPEVDRYARYTVRIPSENLNAFLITLEDNYSLWRLNQESEDITGQHRYTDSRLPDLKAQEARLLAALADVKDAEERLMLERQLANVQVEISRIDASNSEMDYDVTYSTVTIQLYEVNLEPAPELPEEPFGARLRRTISGSVNGFIAFCQGALLLLITVFPALVTLAVFTGIALLALRMWKKREAKLAAANRKSDGASGDSGHGITLPYDEA